MSSRDSSCSRTTITPLLRQENGTFPITPSRNEESTNQSPTSIHHETLTPPTLQQRRTRRNNDNNTFRPLSVFTKSMLVPFNQNFDKAFDILETDSPDRLKIARSLLFSEEGGQELGDGFTTDAEQESGTDKRITQQRLGCATSPEDEDTASKRTHYPRQVSDQEVATPCRQASDTSMIRHKSTRDMNMDLITALKLTSPEKDSNARVSGDFVTLCELPVPDPSDHPAFASRPFEVRTQAPLVFTSTGAEEIRAYKTRGYKSFECESDNNERNVERKVSLFGLGLRIPTPSSAKSRNAISPPENSSFPALVSSPYAVSNLSCTKEISPTAGDICSARGSVTIDRSAAVRNFSGFFKRRNTHERSDPGSPASLLSPRTSVDNPNLGRQDLEQYLRRTTFTPTYDFDPYSPYPRHPNTGRGWKSRNLKCTTCSTANCAVCHRVCCAYRAAVLALEIHGESSPARPLALQRIQEITKLYPYGKEAPTFLQCTAEMGGSKMGCGKIVCPDCCGVCPNDACRDTVCRKCKPKMWEECEWHEDGAIIVER